MTTTKTIYIINGSTGEWSDRSEFVVEAHTNESKAKERVEILSEEDRKKIEKYYQEEKEYNEMMNHYWAEDQKFEAGEIDERPDNPDPEGNGGPDYWDSDRTSYYISETVLIED